MKKLAILGGIVLVLIAVIKIGTMVTEPTDRETTESQTTSSESLPDQQTPAVSSSEERIIITIENEDGLSPTETLPSLPPESDSTPVTTAANEAQAPASDIRVTPMDSKIMYAIKGVNIRKSNSTDSELLGGLYPGGEVKATGETDNGWIRISYDGGNAYVYKTYLSSNKADVIKETTAARSETKAPKKTTAANKTTAAPSAAPAPSTAPTQGQIPSDETIAPFPGS